MTLWRKLRIKNVAKIVREKIRRGDPFDALQIVLAEVICKKLANKNISVESIERFTNANNTPVAVKINANGEIINTTWIYEQGLWKINSFQNFKVSSLNKNGIDKNFGQKDFDLAFKLGYAPSISKHYKYEFYFAVERSKFRFFNFGSHIFLGQKDLIIKNLYITNYNSEFYGGVGVFAGAQLPIRLNFVYLVPYCKFFGGFSIAGDVEETKDLFGTAIMAGTDVVFRLNRKTGLAVGVGYKKRFIDLRPSFIDLQIGVIF